MKFLEFIVQKQFAFNDNRIKYVVLYNVINSTYYVCRSTLVCAWGEEGAMGLTSDGTIVQSKAFPPSKIVDTLGAGDTFVASTIYFLNAGYTLEQSIKYGCQVAGGKVGLKGYDGLEQLIGKIKK